MSNSIITMSKTRLEALTDGVFAIVMTLLVLEFKIPHFKTEIVTNPMLLESLSKMRGTLFAYVLTFAVMITFWNSHHFLINICANADRIVVLLNMLFLGCLSLIPFSTGFLGEYWYTSTACILYGVNILAAHIVHLINYNYVWKNKNIQNHEVPTRNQTQARIRLFITLIFNILGILVAIWNPVFSLVLFILPIVFNTIPGLLNLVEKLLHFEIK
jgi:uncharacterized membrane protein